MLITIDRFLGSALNLQDVMTSSLMETRFESIPTTRKQPINRMNIVEMVDQVQENYAKVTQK